MKDPASIVAAIVEDLRSSLPFHGLPAKTRPQNALYQALNQALLSLRMPLHHVRLGKPRPKPAAYDQAIQQGLAILAAFAAATGTQRAIVPLHGGAAGKTSLQPRPWDVNWTPKHALSPPEFTDPTKDPLTRDDHGLPRVSAGDFVHLPRKLALAFIGAHSEQLAGISGVATFEFQLDDQGRSDVRLILRDRRKPHDPPVMELLRHR
jgi:hypothetical protein